MRAGDGQTTARRWIAAVGWLLLAGRAAAGPLEVAPPPPADALTVEIHAEDADRFARLFAATGGKPTAAQLQKGYLDGASYGVAVFTPGRIGDAARLAKAVARDPAAYDRAIRECLPAAKAAVTDLRAIYLALHGLLPERKLPQIYLVFGAGNSGGTAGPGAQVLGLEVLCAQDRTVDGFRAILRRFFAHETVHTLQRDPATRAPEPLLTGALEEGAADFVAAIVTGQVPDPERAAWAAPREAGLWSEFRKDMAKTRGIDLGAEPEPKAAVAAYLRWLGNYGNAPPGWPYELGYWIGMRIWQSYYDAAPDKRAAIRAMLDFEDAEAVLERSGYPPATVRSDASISPPQ
ncbi:MULTISPECIES: hypothetical protein [unclassified Sphingomonas]|uniref:hypothetical protein n=1 Tax=unclassified Sphingomonas TaxID=196159 RepID=UPI0006F8193A|nr:MULTISPECIES: hypothetical protein [unclassified Sphingomonas]KQX25446.1 hypothetical protein ASD17_21885 [Sphingomonas sp. Root1294]KQY66438.1 hypothetical protein ASD39_11690 [Sphingomonas sp. Root50]KRB90245.1 hypothetical protein ASE22_15260 [Sphingomonas sp. Root720]